MSEAKSVKWVQDSVICVIWLIERELRRLVSVDIGASFCNLCMDKGLLPDYLCNVTI